MANSKVVPFPSKKGTKRKSRQSQENISRKLLQELTRDEAYRRFSETEDFYKRIGNAVANARKRRKLSVAHLANQIGKSEKIVLRMEKGEYRQYTVKLLLQLAAATNTQILIDLVDNLKSSKKRSR